MFQPGQDVRKPHERDDDVEGGGTGDGIRGDTARRREQPYIYDNGSGAGSSRSTLVTVRVVRRSYPFTVNVLINQFTKFRIIISYSPLKSPEHNGPSQENKTRLTVAAGVRRAACAGACICSAEKIPTWRTRHRGTKPTRTDNCGYRSVNSVSFQLNIL